LIDGLGALRPVLRERFGETVRLRLIDDRRPWWRGRISGGVTAPGERTFGLDLGGALIEAAEERLWWNRFGL
jgi:hypothetical protein